MKKILVGLTLILSACNGDITTPTTIASPIILPAPSPSPIFAPLILVSISAKPLGGGSSVSAFQTGVEYVLHADIEAFDSTGKRILAPPVAFWAWGNFSDPQSHCAIFGEVNSSHPHGQCDAIGLFTAQATASGFDGKVLGISILYTAFVF